MTDFSFLVYIDPFINFETYYPELVAINSQGVVVNKLDFTIREAEEMRVLTTASLIAPNVYVRFSLLPLYMLISILTLF